MTHKRHLPHIDPLDFNPRQYTMRSGWKTWLGSLGLLAVIFGATLAGILRPSDTNPSSARTVILLCAAFALLGLYVLLWVIRARVTLSPNALEVRGVFTSKTLRREEIIGWRTVSQRNMPPTIWLVPRSGGNRTLKLSQAVDLDQNFYEWLHRFPNLDAEDARTSEEEVLANTELGDTRDERRQALERGKKIARIFMVVTLTICAWGTFIPLPYRGVVAILAVVPIVAVIASSRSRGLYRLDDVNKDPHPNFAVPFVFPGAVLAFRALTDFKIINSWRVWLISIGIGMVLAIAAATSDSSLRAKRGTLIAMFFCATMYGFGVGLEANALFDQSPSESFPVTVLGKHVSSGKSTSYRLHLAPWGPRDQPNKVLVTSDVYDKLQPGDSVCISQHDGALGVRWYTVSLCR